MSFEIGQRVVVRSVGIGTITELAGRAPSGQPRPLVKAEKAAFYVVTSPTRVTCVAIATAHDLIRTLVSREEANDLLARLRVDGVEPDVDGDIVQRSIAVMKDGAPAAHADFLRELYALDEIDHQQGMAILTFEDIVLDEIAAVLGEDRGEIEAEMRERYPAFARRVAANRARIKAN